jgi:uroporphyrinogen decarboxylase
MRLLAGDFLNLCKNPSSACEIALQPLRRFDFDAAILFSDILVVPDAMGLGLYFDSNMGPKFHKVIRSKSDVDDLTVLRPETDLGYVMRTITHINRALNNSVPLIGFSGSPWTLACYMVEGGSSKDFRYLKEMMYTQPDTLHQLLELLSNSIANYLICQINYGVHVVQIFDTWGGILSEPCYKSFSLRYITQIIKTIRLHFKNSHIPIIVFTKNGGQWLSSIKNTGADAIGIDWTTSMSYAREKMDGKLALQGNMDPSILCAEPSVIRREVERILADFGPNCGHIFNLGHGVQKYTDPSRIKVCVDAVHELSRMYHSR